MPTNAPQPPSDAGTQTDTPEAPQFHFRRYVVRKASFEAVAPQPREEGETRPSPVPLRTELRGGIHIDPLGSRAIVGLEITVVPDPKWQPYRIEVMVQGFFTGENCTLEVFKQFCRRSAPPILFPYVRQIVSTLTADAAFGSLRLPPMNIQALLDTAWSEAQGPETSKSE